MPEILAKVVLIEIKFVVPKIYLRKAMNFGYKTPFPLQSQLPEYLLSTDYILWYYKIAICCLAALNVTRKQVV